MLLEPLVSASSKLLLAGDLNFHVNDPSEGNAYQSKRLKCQHPNSEKY